MARLSSETPPFLGSGIVLLTVVVNSMTMRKLIALLRINEDTEEKALMQRQALKRLLRESVAEEDALKRKDLFSTVVWHQAQRYYLGLYAEGDEAPSGAPNEAEAAADGESGCGLKEGSTSSKKLLKPSSKRDGKQSLASASVQLPDSSPQLKPAASMFNLIDACNKQLSEQEGQRPAAAAKPGRKPSALLARLSSNNSSTVSPPPSPPPDRATPLPTPAPPLPPAAAELPPPSPDAASLPPSPPTHPAQDAPASPPKAARIGASADKPPPGLGPPTPSGSLMAPGPAAASPAADAAGNGKPRSALKTALKPPKRSPRTAAGGAANGGAGVGGGDGGGGPEGGVGGPDGCGPGGAGADRPRRVSLKGAVRTVGQGAAVGREAAAAHKKAKGTARRRRLRARLRLSNFYDVGGSSKSLPSVEVRRRILMMTKQSYWNQFQQGMISKEAAQFLRGLSDSAVDDDCQLTEWAAIEKMLRASAQLTSHAVHTQKGQQNWKQLSFSSKLVATHEQHAPAGGVKGIAGLLANCRGSRADLRPSGAGGRRSSLSLPFSRLSADARPSGGGGGGAFGRPPAHMAPAGRPALHSRNSFVHGLTRMKSFSSVQTLQWFGGDEDADAWKNLDPLQRLQRRIDSVGWTILVCVLVIVAEVLTVVTRAQPPQILFGEGSAREDATAAEWLACGWRAFVCALFTLEMLVRCYLKHSVVEVPSSTDSLCCLLIPAASVPHVFRCPVMPPDPLRCLLIPYGYSCRCSPTCCCCYSSS